MTVVLFKIKNEEAKKNIKKINLIPMILYKIGSSSVYNCKLGKIKSHTIAEATEIMKKK